MDFEEWLPVGAPRLFRFAALVTGSALESEDLVQDVLTNAFRKWDRIESAGDIDAYLRRAVVNRRNSWWRRLVRGDIATGSIGAGEHTYELPTGDGALWQACLNLPEKQRQALVLRYYEDLDFAQIARILGCAEGTSRSLVHRGLASLRKSHSREEFA